MHRGLFSTKYVSAIFFAAILAVGLVGISYAYFSETFTMKTAASMGSLDVVFSNVELDPSALADPSCTISADIVDNGKNIALDIENAAPGFNATLNYEVTNKGSVPVVCQLVQPDNAGQVIINLTTDTEYINPNGGTGQGHLTISVSGEAAQAGSCGISVGLTFQQALVQQALAES